MEIANESCTFVEIVHQAWKKAQYPHNASFHTQKDNLTRLPDKEKPLEVTASYLSVNSMHLVSVATVSLNAVLTFENFRTNQHNDLRWKEPS